MDLTNEGVDYYSNKIVCASKKRQDREDEQEKRWWLNKKYVLVVTKVSMVCQSMLKNFTLVIDIHMAGSNAVFQTLQIKLWVVKSVPMDNF